MFELRQMFRPSKKPRERVEQIMKLLEDYRSAPKRQVARAAIEQLLIERELPWLMKQLGRARKGEAVAAQVMEAVGAPR